MKKTKPTRWGFERGLVAPKWRRFWHNPEFCVFFMAGARPIDLVAKSGPSSVLGTPTVTQREFGPALEIDANGEFLQYSGRGTGTGAITICGVFETTTLAETEYFFTTSSTNKNYQLSFVVTSGDLRFTLGGVADNTVFTSAVTVGRPFFYSVSFDPSTDVRDAVFRDLPSGHVRTHTATDTGTPLTGDGIYEVGGFSVLSNNNLIGYVGYVYTKREFTPLAYQVELAKDPFGPFRMDDTMVLKAPAAATGKFAGSLSSIGMGW